MASPIFCPFCGKTDSEVVAAEFEGYKRRVECFSCGATGPLGETEDQAVELWNGPRFDPNREVECTAAEFSIRGGWDGVPFRPFPEWVVTAAQAGRIKAFEPGADYAGYWVETPKGRVFATAGDRIRLESDGSLTVRETGHWRPQDRPKWSAPEAQD